MESNIKRSFFKFMQIPFCIVLFLCTFLFVEQKSAFAGTENPGSAQIKSQAEQKFLKGNVTDIKGIPLPGVTVVVKGTSMGTITDVNGNFQLSIPADKQTLVFSFVGMKAQEIPISGRTEIKVSMEEEAIGLDEVIAIGYGTQSREKITTSISKLDTKVLENIPFSHPASALQGTIAGLRVQSYNGQPGLGPRIILRGGTSINNPNGAEPLYLVDGVIRPNMDDIAADGIESIQVLKDAAATAIYGARASNGVVLVTTKSGKAGAMKISFSYDFTRADESMEVEFVNGREYIEAARQSVVWNSVKVPSSMSKLTLATGYGTGNDLTNKTAFTPQYLSEVNKHKLNEGWESMPDPVDPSKTIIFKETDFQKLRKRTAFSHNYFLSASGGTDKATYNVGLGYLDGEGTALNSDYKRLSYSMSGDLRVTNKLKVSGRMMYTNVDDHNIYGAPGTMWTVMINTFQRSASLPSTTKLTFEDGTYAPGQSSSAGNPLYYQVGPYAPLAKNVSNTLSMALSARWEILPGLSFDPQISLYNTDARNHTFQPGYLSGITSFNTTRSAGSYYSNNKYYQADAVLNYTKTFNKHSLGAMAGFSHYEKQYFTVNAYGKGASTDLIPTLNASSTPTTVGGSESQFVTEGVFSRINYDFDGKYLLNMNVRYDGASNLGADYRFGFFPGISAGWNVYRENFWKEVLPENLVHLKLRGSYGENGNIQGLGDFQAQGSYSVGSQYAGGAAIQPSVIPNANLQWEESRTLDVGFDLGVFNKRINVLFDYYRRVTENLLTNVSLPPSSGFSSVLTNYGSLENKGVEVDINAQILGNDSPFKWNMSFNIANVKTKILKLPFNGVENNRQGGVYIWDPSIKDYAWKGGLQEGGRLGDMFAYKQIGVYSTDEEAASAPVDMTIGLTDKRKFGGDVNFADMDGNGLIDSKDQVHVGNPYPTLTGGFSNSLGYKNFYLDIRTDFMTGHTIHNYGAVVADGQLQGDLMPTKKYWKNSWKKQGDITDTPRYLWQNQQQNISKNSTYRQKGDFLAVREVTLSYSLPSSLLRKMKLSSMRLNLTGNNLYYFTGYEGLNPEDGGDDYGRYPNPRSFTLGVNITL